MRVRVLIALLWMFVAARMEAQVYTMGNLGTVSNACGGLFYDSQGPGANYQNNEFYTATFCAPAGQVITFTFTDFATEAGWDYLDVYNGPSTASPLLGSYTGNVGPGVISSTVGGCLTFVFESDGGTRRRGWEAAISCGDPPPSTNNGDSCPNATPFCTGNAYLFPNNTNVPSLGAINCLGSSPNPVWYYMEIQNPGTLDIDIAQYDALDFPIDVDFLLWGPFASTTVACTQIAAGTAPVVDCSYSGSAFEQANITNAQTGEIYILLLTNYANDVGYITFNSTAGSTATTNCDILCNITALSATPTACDPATNTYSVSGTLTVSNPPSSGILTLTTSCGATTTISAPFPSQINYTLAGINSTGGSCNVVATFSADPTCTITESYTAPASCASVSLNCPSYSSTSTSPSTACSNQSYYLDVANTACNGLIYMTVYGNYGSTYGSEITWQLVSLATNTAVATGGPGTDGGVINFAVPALNPTTYGTIFRLDVFDSFGDGFNGTGGTISVRQGTTTIGGPITGAFGDYAYTIFGANISVSAATITVATPAGNVVQTVQNCNDFRVPISINNPNFCNTISATLPWIVTCNSTGATLASGSNTLTVYPTLPASSNDVVSISYNTSTCDWEVSGNNDCDAGDIGTIFTISPNPNTLTNTGCTGGSQTFDVTYIGVGGGPSCCATGGTLIPIQIDNAYPHGSYSAASTPFGGLNNAAYLNIPPNTVGGNATSVTLDIDMAGFCMDPAGTNDDFSYWVTVIIDGQIISDVPSIDPGPATYSQTILLSDIPGGFNSSSEIEIYIYPNRFANGAGTVFQTYNPTANCLSLGNGIWTASSITANLAVTFEEFEPTPASCLYPTTASFACCTPTSVSNASATICSGGSLATLSTWQNAIDAANPTCVVYSSVLPVAGTSLPDNVLPDGVNATASPITQTVSAYAYCDADGSSTINAGDTYTLISTYTLTVNPNVSAGTSGSTTLCSSGSSVNLFAILGGTPSTSGTWSGPSALSGGNLGTFNPANNTAGTYTYTVTGTSPCPNVTATVAVTLSAAPSATIAYSGSPFCKSETAAQSVSLTGTSGGTFTALPAGLSINASTGAITPSTSTAGTYTVTYSIAASGGCPAASTTATVEIVAVPDVATNLPSYSTCTGPTLATAGAYTINISSTQAGATFNWSGSDGNSGTGTPINYPIANNTCTDQTVTFTITSSYNGCTSAPISRVLTLRPKPIATFTVSPNPFCLGNTATVTFTGTSCPGSAYNWTWPAGVNVLSGSGAGPYSISFNAAGTYILRHQIVGPASLGSCTSPLVSVSVDVTDPPNAGTGASTTVCSSGSSVNLFSLLGGSPSSSGTWSGPSSLGGGNLGTFDPSTNAAGTYTYTVAGTAPCTDATAQVVVNVTNNPSAAISYSGSPFCTSTASPQAVSLTGSSGGTYSASPAGLSINPSTGAITPSSSTPGTYTVTYNIVASGGCAAFTTTNTVVITAAPVTPGLSPNPPCSGIANDFTASGGTWYSFTLNGTEVQAPSADNTYTSPVLTTGDQVCVISYPLPPFTFDGNINEAAWGNPLSTSAGGAVSSFGVLNNLDALYLSNGWGRLYGALAGQVLNNSNNRFLLFIDCLPGGFNSLAGWTNRTNAPYWSVENLSSSISFDAGFAPDYVLAMNQASGVAYFDLYNMQTNTNVYLGQSGMSEPLGYQNNGGAGNYTQGFEFAVSEAQLGNPTGTIQVFAMMVNDPGSGNPTLVSNQFLTPANFGESDYGTGFIAFGSAAPNPISYALGADCSTQSCVTATDPVTPTFNAVSPICSGASLSALPTTSNNGITGTWSPALNNTATTTYTFTPTAGQCATTTTLTITVNPLITPTFDAVADICSGASLSALLTTSNNGITGTWSPALNNTATTTYTFTPTAGQCATTTTLTITVNPLITPTFTAVADICSGASLSALPTTSNNGITGTWSPALNNTATTTYTFTPTAGQCATTTTLTITVNPLITPTFTAVADICSGASLSALPTTSNNGITGTWSPALNNTATTTYTFTPTAGQCATTTTLTITVNPLITPTFDAVADICSGASLSALPTTSNNGITGTWSPALNNTATTTYTFTPTAGQCATTTTLTITVNPLITPTFTAVADICSGASLSALPTTSNNGITGTWSPALNNTATTTYTFTPTAGQCATTTTLTITVNSPVVPVFNALAPFCQGTAAPSLPATSTNGISGTWSPSVVSNVSSTTYTFTPTAGQCATSQTLNSNVLPKPLTTPIYHD